MEAIYIKDTVCRYTEARPHVVEVRTWLAVRTWLVEHGFACYSQWRNYIVATVAVASVEIWP